MVLCEYMYSLSLPCGALIWCELCDVVFPGKAIVTFIDSGKIENRIFK